MSIQHPEERRRLTEARSKVALEVLLHVYAVGATIVVVRTIMLLIGVTDRVWIGKMTFGSTAVVTDALAAVPGFGHVILGPFSLLDLILIAAVLLIPLGMLASTPRP